MQASKVLIPNPNARASSRLIIIPHAGGNASQYLNLAKEIRDSEAVVLDLAGRGFAGSDQNPNWADLLGEWDRELNLYTDKSFILMGHSFGSLIGFEFFKKNKFDVDHKFIASASLAPTLNNLKNIPLTMHLGDDDFTEFLKGYGLVSDKLIENKDFFKPFLKVLRFDFTLMEKYKDFLIEDIAIDTPITSFLGNEDKLYDIAKAQEWGDVTLKKHETVMFNGNHFYLLESSLKVAHRLNTELGELA